MSEAETFDAQPEKAATVVDLSTMVFHHYRNQDYRNQAVARETIYADSRPIEQQLAELGFYDLKNQCATHAGVLLFGKNPRYFIPGAYVQYLHIQGTELTDEIFEEAEIDGDLLTVLQQLYMRIKLLLRSRPRPISALREQPIYDYPRDAIRELLMNAVMHRDYHSNAPIRWTCFTDRIEIQSPGGLYGSMTPEQLGTACDYRNPVIAEAMKTMGFVYNFAEGIKIAKHALAKNGSPDCKLTIDGDYFLATIYKRN